VEKSSIPMKLLFERTAHDYKILPMLLFQDQIDPAKPPFPSAKILDKPSPTATAKPLLYNRLLVDFNKVGTFDIRMYAFLHK
jgi:hypothetical protein